MSHMEAEAVHRVGPRAWDRAWIIATVPIGYEARVQVAKVLAPYFREVDGKAFGLVYAFLWDSRLCGKMPER